MIQEFKSKGGLEAQTLLGMITVEQGDSIAGMEMIRNAAEREYSIAEILLYGPNEKTGQPTDTLKLRLIASRFPLAYSLLGDAYYKPDKKNTTNCKPSSIIWKLKSMVCWENMVAVQVLDYCQNNNDFKLTADDVKQLAIIAKPICNATE